MNEIYSRFSRAEACGVVVIKPLEDAIRDQDHIYATVCLSQLAVLAQTDLF